MAKVQRELKREPWVDPPAGAEIFLKLFGDKNGDGNALFRILTIRASAFQVKPDLIALPGRSGGMSGL